MKRKAKKTPPKHPPHPHPHKTAEEFVRESAEHEIPDDHGKGIIGGRAHKPHFEDGEEEKKP